MDYQAPASASVPTDLEPALRARIASGGIRVVQRDLATLGDESVTAAAAVRCVAEQGGPAWLVHDVLAVSAQGPGSGIFVPRNLLQLAARLGLDVRSFAGCLGRPDVADAVRAETDSGKGAGLAAGPAVVLRNGAAEVARFTGPLDTTTILAAIDAER